MFVKTFKNLFQTIAALAAVAFIDLCLIVGYIYSLFAEQPNYGWVLLVAAGAFLCLFFIFGFYWIFQKVTIDENGIKITILNKVITKCSLDDVESYTVGAVMRTPAIKIQLKNGKHINIDKRNRILKCLEFFGLNKSNI